MKRRRWLSIWQNSQGFTLIELAVVVFVISVLIALALPHFRGTGEKAQQVACEGNQRLMRAQLENYFLTEKTYPQGASDLERMQAMVERRYLQALPVCPSGGDYKVTVAVDGQSASVSCSTHGTLGQ